MSARQCGECGLCCKILGVPEIEKPANKWCGHYAAHKGCTIYESRPEPCRAFRCLWLDHPEFDEAWLPKRAGFFMWEAPVPNGRRLVVEVDLDRKEAWTREPYASTLRGLAARTPEHYVEIIVRIGKTIYMLFPEGLVELGEWRELPIQSGYRHVRGRLVPFAVYVEPPPSPEAA